MQLKKSIVFAFVCIYAINCESFVGAPKKELNDDEKKEVEELFADSLTQLKGEENGADFRSIELSSFTVQLVSGKKYKFNAKLEHTDGNVQKICKITLWHQPWTGLRETNFECDDSTKYKVTKMKRSKRAAAFGAPKEVDPETLEQLKNNITTSFSQQNGKKTFQLLEVFGAEQKIVSGILYTVRTMVNVGNGPQKCNIEIWSKPWLDSREVWVICEDDYKIKIENSMRSRRSANFRPLLLEDDEQIDDESDSMQSHFNRFKRNFGRVYENEEEEAMRFRIFQNNMYLIRQLNKFEQGSAIYGVTDFADLTQYEYFQRTGLWKQNINDDDDDDEELTNGIKNPLADIPNIKLPKSYDWREHGAVTPVKNQGNCGSCWAFSVTGNVEGLNAIKTGQLKSFSEQELIDCDDLDAGCNGGLPDNAVKFIEKEGGLELESDYPYTAHRSKKCNFNASLSRVQVSGVVDFKKGDENGMAKWLTINGPISIGINANAMQFYRGGISHPWKALCRSSSLDHGVLIVGYGVAEYPVFNKTIPYWIIKNSWGPRWGEQGYYRVHRGDNTCGVSSMASSAVLAKSSNY